MLTIGGRSTVHGAISVLLFSLQQNSFYFWWQYGLLWKHRKAVIIWTFGYWILNFEIQIPLKLRNFNVYFENQLSDFKKFEFPLFDFILKTVFFFLLNFTNSDWQCKCAKCPISHLSLSLVDYMKQHNNMLFYSINYRNIDIVTI